MFIRIGSVATLVVALCALMFGGPLGQRAEAQQPEDFDIPNGHFYTQTRGQYPPGYGFAVADDGIMFWTTLRQLGGVDVVGYPVSQRFLTNGQAAQAFQRLIFIWQSESGTATVIPTSSNVALIPSDALVPAPWAGPITGGRGGGPAGPPQGPQGPGGYGQGGPYGAGPGYGQQPMPGYGQGPQVPPVQYGQPGTYPVQPGTPYQPGYPYAPQYPYNTPYQYPYAQPFAPYAPYTPYGPGAYCDPVLYPYGCYAPAPVVYPTATFTPVPSNNGCEGDENVFFDPGTGTVGQPLYIKVTSSKGSENVSLDGPFGPRFTGVAPGGQGWVWTWVVTPNAAGTYGYTFYVDGNNCAGAHVNVTVSGNPPPPTNTPLPTATNQPLPPGHTDTRPGAPAPTNTPLPPGHTDTSGNQGNQNNQAPVHPTNTPVPPHPTNTPVPPRPTNTPVHSNSQTQHSPAPPQPTATPTLPAGHTNTSGR